MIKGEYEMEFYVDIRNEHRWRLRHQNGKVVACSGEGYKNEKDCKEEAAKLFPPDPPEPLVDEDTVE